MLKKEEMYIVKSTEIALDTFEMVLQNEYISATAKPGQFLHISVSGHTLRRPISIANIDKENGTVTVLFKILGAGTAHLADYQAGMKLDVLGPGGNGFNLENAPGSTILLIGGGIGVPPLYSLGKTLKAEGMKIISVLGFQKQASVFYEDAFRALGETYIVTDDGSCGTKGFVTDVTKQITDFDRYYTCGPTPMLQAVTRQLKGKSGYVSLEERMGCGVGACFACVIPSDDEGGYKKICKDGPVFAADEVTL